MRPYLKSRIQFWATQKKTDFQVLECVQRRAIELEKDVEDKSDEKQLKQLEGSVWRKRGSGDLSHCREMGLSLFSQVTNDQKRGKYLKLHKQRFRGFLISLGY